MVWAEGLRETIDAHEWNRRRHDVVLSVSMTFMSAADRKVFGEYYTADWLAALIVDETLDDAWLSITIERAESAKRRGTLNGESPNRRELLVSGDLLPSGRPLLPHRSPLYWQDSKGRLKLSAETDASRRGRNRARMSSAIIPDGGLGPRAIVICGGSAVRPADGRESR